MIAALLINLFICLGICVTMAFLSNILGPKKSMAGDKGMPFETGMPPISPAFGRMTSTYQRFAILFVVFDVDLAFLVPFILIRPEAGAAELWVLTAFISLVALTLAVVWRQGALECD